MDVLLTVADAHLDAELLVDMLSEVLGGIDGTMLTTRTAKREHQRGKATLDISAHVGIGEFIDRIEEGQDFTVVLQESDDRLVESRQFLVGFISARVMGATAVKNITSTITTLILGDTLAVRETEDPHYQRTLGIVLRECSRTVLGMGFIRIEVGGLVAVGTTGNGLYLLELGQFGQLLQDFHEV